MERVLFVHAHPSDETVGTGATISWLVRNGSTVTVLVATRGERGDLIPEDLRGLSGQPEAYVENRLAEFADAMQKLGVSDFRILGEPGARWEGLTPRRYEDSGMAWGAAGPQALPDASAQTLVSADEGEVASDIAAVILQLQPDVVVSYGEDGLDGHPDRRRVHSATRWATEVLRVPFYVLGPYAGRGSARVDDVESLEAKREALTSYRSQLTVGTDTFDRASGAPIPLDAPETFGRLRPVQHGFSGYGRMTRIIACGFALVIGAVVGAILTVIHQATVLVGSTPVPWGLIAALAIATALLVGLRVVYESRVVAGFAAVGLLAVEGFLSIGTPSGSVLVANNLPGIVWTIGSVLIVAVVLAWPRLPSPRGVRIKTPAAKG